MEQGSAQLPFDRTYGYLPALLEALRVPVESQMAVFSKTSIQSLRIEPGQSARSLLQRFGGRRLGARRIYRTGRAGPRGGIRILYSPAEAQTSASRRAKTV